ncbi:15461_t:CDS:2 [Acaulospora colombiana]|uniref:15461_t:CDS:1 n=1 Tax=Acaulospora colombiana TaxID=27376 RepID=A0ACA9MRG0_9GLOM|nr:15461_t:CDS:2 [Acaulospora colombiana]
MILTVNITISSLENVKSMRTEENQALKGTRHAGSGVSSWIFTMRAKSPLLSHLTGGESKRKINRNVTCPIMILYGRAFEITTGGCMRPDGTGRFDCSDIERQTCGDRVKGASHTKKIHFQGISREICMTYDHLGHTSLHYDSLMAYHGLSSFACPHPSLQPHGRDSLFINISLVAGLELVSSSNLIIHLVHFRRPCQCPAVSPEFAPEFVSSYLGHLLYTVVERTDNFESPSDPSQEEIELPKNPFELFCIFQAPAANYANHRFDEHDMSRIYHDMWSVLYPKEAADWKETFDAIGRAANELRKKLATPLMGSTRTHSLKCKLAVDHIQEEHRKSKRTFGGLWVDRRDGGM